MYISTLISDSSNAYYYTARQSERGHRYIWAKVSLFPMSFPASDVRVEASEVPEWVREQAYNLFEGDRTRELVP